MPALEELEAAWIEAWNDPAFREELDRLLRDYAGRRSVFGRPLRAHALQVETFAELQVEYEAALALTFEAVRLLGQDFVRDDILVVLTQHYLFGGSLLTALLLLVALTVG